VADIRRPYTRSTPCHQDEDTGSSVVSGTAAGAPAAVSEKRLLALVKALDAETATALAEAAVPLQIKNNQSLCVNESILFLTWPKQQPATSRTTEGSRS